jgi:hypothetical protein
MKICVYVQRLGKLIKRMFHPPEVPTGRLCDECLQQQATHAFSNRHMVCARCYVAVRAGW